jgi:hypothetical protein
MSLLALSARASYIISIQQVGSEVVAIGSGSFDTTDLSFGSNGPGSSFINAREGQIGLGPTTATTLAEYSGLTGPASWGTNGPNTAASSGSGPAVAVGSLLHAIFVPSGYASGTPLATSTATFSNQSFSTLGITPGTYTDTWGTGPHADSLTIRAGTPEPTGLSLLALAALTMARRRRRPIQLP